VNKFLTWKLPDDFFPDCGIIFDGRKPDANGYEPRWPIGTNLLTAQQARAMFEHCFEREESQSVEPVVVAFSDRVVELFLCIHGSTTPAVMDALRLASAHAFSEIVTKHRLPQPTQVTCQIHGHVIGACGECNTQEEAQSFEPVGIVEPIGDGFVEAMLFQALPVGTRLFTHPAPKIERSVEPVAIFHGLVDSGEHGAFNLDLLKMIPRGAELFTRPAPERK